MDILKTSPAVFAIKDTYQIMIPVTCDALMWIRVGKIILVNPVPCLLAQHPISGKRPYGQRCTLYTKRYENSFHR